MATSAMFMFIIINLIFRSSVIMTPTFSKHHPDMCNYENTYKNWPEISARRKTTSSEEKNSQDKCATNQHHPHHAIFTFFVVIIHKYYNNYLLIRLELCIQTKYQAN